jgi:hypothetical protein
MRLIVGSTRVVQPSTRDHVGVAVTVHIARARDAFAELRALLIRLELGGRRSGHTAVGDPRGAAVEHERGPFIDLARVVEAHRRR